MGYVRRRVLVWCLLWVVLLAPLAAPVGASGNGTTDGNAITDANWSSDHGLDYREEWSRDAVRNGTNATADVLANATNGTLAPGQPNASGRTLPAFRTLDDLGVGVVFDRGPSGGLDGASSGAFQDTSIEAVDGASSKTLHDASPVTELPGHGADRPRTVLRPELPRLAVTDGALVVELRTVAVGDLPTVAVPLAVDESSEPDAADGSHQSADAGDRVPAADGAAGPNDGGGPTAGPASNPDAESGAADAGDGAPDGESTASGGAGLAGGVAVEFAPPLGTALFVVAARPWLGLLWGAVTVVANWLGNAFVLLRYGSHDGSDPLEHETRERIHERVSESPGRSLTELSEALETPLSTLRHHVRVLERERVVVSRKLRGNRRVYPIGAENAELAAALDEDSSAAVIAALHDGGRVTVGELVDRVEKSYSTVSYHLSRLVDDGLVVQEREGRKTLSRLDPDVESLLDAPEDSSTAAPERSGREASAD